MNELQFPTFKEHVQSRSMWIGSNIISENNYSILIDGKFVKTTIEISDALYKTFDEVLVNSVDQYIKSVNYDKSTGGPVTNISVSFDTNTGEITVYNDGKGIPIYFNKDINQYTVEAIISREYSGSNFDDTINPDRVVGGLNGLGLKLININSVRFEIETVDLQRKTKYTQVCEDNMNIINKPIIDENYNKISYTKVKFIPDYAKLCRINSVTINPDWIKNKTNLTNFMKIIETRMYQTSVFISCINYRHEFNKKIQYNKKAKIIFNKNEIKIKSLSDFMKLYGVEDLLEIELFGDEIRFPWTICVGKIIKDTFNITIVNGVNLTKGGSHVNLIYNQIKTALQTKCNNEFKEKLELKDSMLKKIIFISDVRQIPLPQFAGQVKDSVTIGSKDLNIMKKLYIIPETFINKLWKMIKDVIEYKIIQESLATSVKRKKNVKVRKYEKAEITGCNSGLFIPEGDSAALPIRNILTSKSSKISKKNHGMYNIQGVPPNVCKKIKEVTIDGEKRIIQDSDLQNNIALQGLATVLNLNYCFTYKTDKEFKTLNYGYIVIATDQDLDGIGNICSLIIVFIVTFWPELVSRGFIRRFQTPIMRVYISENVYEFYSLRDYKKWVTTNYIDEDRIPDKIKKNIFYYKGLGEHTPEEVINMGINIQSNIITYTKDDVMNHTMKLYYGCDTGNRKEILLTPVVNDYTDEMLKSRKVPISTHFDIESKSFQLYFMKRKLKNAIDGMIPSQRKALAGARIMFQKESSAKVYQVTGYVTKKMHYQHGDASMNETIIKMAQTFTGSNNIPIFIPISNGFGDRVNGRGVSASPRYIKTKYNNKIMDIIFPPEDDWLLDYVYDDGMQAEPKYYVPIVPYSILENSTTTGVGWKIDVWGRDHKWVLHLLKQMIKYNYPEESNGKIIAKPYGLLNKVWLPNDMTTKLGTTTSSKNVSEICFGKYTIDYDKNIIIINQLPLKIWSYKLKCYITGIHHKTGKTEDKDGKPLFALDLVEDVIDNTGNNINELIIKLKPGSIDVINLKYGNETIDPIEDYLGLYQILSQHLNMISCDDSVIEFKSYEEVMEYWFILRRELYKIRIDRQKILLRLKILYNKQLLNFINMDENKTINLDKKNKVERNKILEDNNFVKFNKNNLFQPKYIKVDKLEYMILEHDASYKYIDDITKGMTEESSIDNLIKTIDKLEKILNDLNDKTWQTLWLEELNNFELMLNEGIKTNWLFGIKQHVFKKYN